MFFLGAAAVGLLSTAATVFAADKDKADVATHDGKVVSITNSKLVMSTKGKEHSHEVTEDAKLTLDGKACETDELKPGMRIRVTLNDAEPKSAIQIEALDKNLEFAGIQHDGKVVSIKGNKLVMTVVGDEEHTCTLSGDVKVTCDGKVCKASDLKPGMRIRVTSQAGNLRLASQIEALDKNLDFEGS
jgi:uncharacterized protein YdeI (BOF family)